MQNFYGEIKRFRLLGDRLAVEPIEREETTAGGIFLPETARDKSQAGTVLAVGPGCRNKDGQHIPIDVAVGDKVIFAKYAGTEVTFDIGHGVYKVLIINEGDVLAVMDNSEAEGIGCLADDGVRIPPSPM